MQPLMWVVLLMLAAILYVLTLQTNMLSGRKGNESSSSVVSPETIQYLRPGAKYHIEKSPLNLPSVQLTAEEEQQITKKRGIYGGVGDKEHLGGFTKFDDAGVSPNAFNYMLSYLAVKSLIDVGCGRGYSTRYFLRAGAEALCVEGSHDAVTKTLLPIDKVIEHDFTRGPWWPDRTYDAAWAVEFLEHVGRQYMQNYLPIFHKSALIFATASSWGGWHHVEIQQHKWWRTRFEAHGFVYSHELSADMKRYARKGNNHTSLGGHISHSMMVFINPTVASKPEHQHIMGSNGCWKPGSKYNNLGNTGIRCTGADALPAQFETLLDCKLNDVDIWMCNRNISVL